MAAKVKEMTTDGSLGLSDGVNSQESESKKEKKLREKEERRAKKGAKKGGSGGKVLPVVVAFAIIALMVATVYFNLFNLRNKYLGGIIEKIPLVNNLVSTNETDPNNPYASFSKEELQAKIKQLEQELEGSNKQVADLMEMNDVYAKDVSKLQEFESQQVQFKADKLAFDKTITESDPSAYAAFYESVSPENAPELYEEAKAAVAQSKEFKKYVGTFQAMAEKDAAKMLEEMISTDMNLVVLILKNVDNEQAGGILAAMEPANAASVAKQMAPAAQ